MQRAEWQPVKSRGSLVTNVILRIQIISIWRHYKAIGSWGILLKFETTQIWFLLFLFLTVLKYTQLLMP